MKQLNGKRLQLLREAAPSAFRVAFLGQSSRPGDGLWRPSIEAAAHALGLTLIWVAVDIPEQFEAAFAAVAENRAGGKDNGAPGLRPQYHANYYAAFVIGPDGHNIEMVCHEPEA